MPKPKRSYRRKSARQTLIEKAESLTFQILQYQRGSLCEICGRKSDQLGLFHILPKGRYQRLRFSRKNLLLAGWYCCHYPWHHSFFVARDVIYPRLEELLGVGFEDDLKMLDLTSPKITMTYLQTLVMALEVELKELEKGWVHGNPRIGENELPKL